MNENNERPPTTGGTGAAVTGRREQTINVIPIEGATAAKPERVGDVPLTITDRLRRPEPPAGMSYATIQMPEFGVNDD